MAKNNISGVDLLDDKEIASLFEDASIVSCHACEVCRDLRVLFEAIQTDSPQGPIASRLAKIGETMCGDKELWFSEEQESFDNHAERFANVPPGNSGIVTGDASIVHSTITAQTHKEIGKAPAIGREDDSQMRNRLMHGDAA